MSFKKTPLQLVNEEHGGKEKLVERIIGLIERDESEDKDTLKRRLLAASNRKLLRLAQNAETLRTKYGSTEKLAEAVAGMMGRIKDKDYVTRLASFTPHRLLDMARNLSRKAAAPARSPKKAAAK
ncbi:MAG: hypothetical protein HY698_04345 [Deltaproteobacteria bacterium]|nr:hypothetical protein [Deltaproteobacteria bacterium]